MLLSDKNAFMTYLRNAFHQNGIAALLTPEREERFYALTTRMCEVGAHMNLTAIKEPEKIILLHLADSLVGQEYFPVGASVIDVGCGAGFPSLPLAICRPDLHITAFDATAKKVNYVKETAALLGLTNLTALCGRAEEAAQGKMRESFDCATARAVAALPVLSEICLPFVKKDGLFIALKGKQAQEELQAAQNAVKTLGAEAVGLYDMPLTDGQERYAHAVLLFRKQAKTPSAYPRAYGKILKKPL